MGPLSPERTSAGGGPFPLSAELLASPTAQAVGCCTFARQAANRELSDQRGAPGALPKRVMTRRRREPAIHQSPLALTERRRLRVDHVIDLYECDTVDEMCDLEALLIDELKPVLNKRSESRLVAS